MIECNICLSPDCKLKPYACACSCHKKFKITSPPKINITEDMMRSQQRHPNYGSFGGKCWPDFPLIPDKVNLVDLKLVLGERIERYKTGLNVISPSRAQECKCLIETINDQLKEMRIQ